MKFGKNHVHSFVEACKEVLLKDNTEARKALLSAVVSKIVNDHNGVLNFYSINDGAKVEINFNLDVSRNFNS